MDLWQPRKSHQKHSKLPETSILCNWKVRWWQVSCKVDATEFARTVDWMVWLHQAWSILEERVSNVTNLTIFLFKCYIWHSHHRPTCTGNILLLKLFASFVQNNFVYEHIFRACSVALQQRRFTFCHDAVLRVIVSSIKSFLTLYQVSNTKVLYIKFVKADSRLPKTSKN